MSFVLESRLAPLVCKQKSLPERFIFNLVTESNKHKITRRRRKGTKFFNLPFFYKVEKQERKVETRDFFAERG